jgi:hypothetical protein
MAVFRQYTGPWDVLSTSCAENRPDLFSDGRPPTIHWAIGCSQDMTTLDYGENNREYKQRPKKDADKPVMSGQELVNPVIGRQELV